MIPDAKDIALILGLLLLAAGLGAYDWRWAAIAAGVGCIMFGLFGYLRKYGG